MAEYTTVARPYAEAVFKLAVQTSSLQGWSEALGNLKAAFTDPAVNAYFLRPLSADNENVIRLIIKACSSKVDLQDALFNFLVLLNAEKKTILIPLVVDAFEYLKTEADGVKLVDVVSAFPLSEVQLSDLIKKLATRYQYQFKVKTVVVDPRLIGGVAVQFGDQVIDLSVRQKLAQMTQTITH
jgi:F-type H+-transporting ATPase subunit delta